MTDWLQLEKDISKWLSTFASTNIQFRNSHQSIVGFPSNGFRSDGMLASDDTLIAVEVEAGQTHPDTNTGKYWLLHLEHKPYKKIILFQIYTPRFNSYGWRKRLAEFYVEKMKNEVPIEYILIDYRKAKDYDETLVKIKNIVEEKIRQELPSANFS